MTTLWSERAALRLNLVTVSPVTATCSGVGYERRDAADRNFRRFELIRLANRRAVE